VAGRGEVIGGYRLLKQLPTGHTSQVWEAVETASGVHFAIKFLLPQNVANAELRRSLLHEADIGRQLAHPNIIRIVAISRSPDNPYFAMEFFPAGTLRMRLQRKETDFILEYGQDILKQLATALAFMHAQGFVHRDVKPDNLLVSATGEVRLIDFALAEQMPRGLARWFRRRQKAQGTRSYMSPEQIRDQLLDQRADIYSFGATAYEVATGRPPFTGTSNQDLLQKHLTAPPAPPAAHNPEVTREFSDLVLRMLAKKKEDRPRDFHEVLMSMRTVRLFKSVQARPSAD
jgi:serine/threonine protein kinase